MESCVSGCATAIGDEVNKPYSKEDVVTPTYLYEAFEFMSKESVDALVKISATISGLKKSFFVKGKHSASKNSHYIVYGSSKPIKFSSPMTAKRSTKKTHDFKSLKKEEDTDFLFKNVMKMMIFHISMMSISIVMMQRMLIISSSV